MSQQLRITVAPGVLIALTAETLIKLFRERYLAYYKLFMSSAGREKLAATLYYIAEAGIWTLDEHEVGEKIVTMPITWNEMPKLQEITQSICSKMWANKMMKLLWDREFPLHVKMEKIKAESQICGELLEWLRETKGYHIAKYHEHDEGCTEDGSGYGRLICGCSEQMLYSVHTSDLDLLHEFFGIDRKAFADEKDRMLEEIRLQPLTTKNPCSEVSLDIVQECVLPAPTEHDPDYKPEVR